MLVRVLVQTSLVLWLAQQSLQGGVKPQTVNYGRVLPVKAGGMGVKPTGAQGILNSLTKGTGRYPAAHLGVGSLRALPRTGLRPYGPQGGYGPSLGTGYGNILGHTGKRVYGGGYGTVPAYGAYGGYPGARQGYAGGIGNYVPAGGYGPGVSQGAYLGATTGNTGGYGDGATGFLGPMGANGYGNGYGDPYGAALGTGGYAAQGPYGGAVQVPYGNTPVIPAALEANGGYPYGAQQLNLSPSSAKTASKYGGAAQVPYGSTPVIPAALEANGGYPYGTQQLNLGPVSAKSASKYGYGAQLGAAQEAYGEQTGKFGGVSGPLPVEYKV
ncbi:uncharacterized protein KZ484_004994 isoform 2-T2 [Pholidichthys leucotaenia]